MSFHGLIAYVFVKLNHNPLSECTTVYSPTKVHDGCFQATLNICVQIFAWAYFSTFLGKPKSVVAVSCGKYV